MGGWCCYTRPHAHTTHTHTHALQTGALLIRVDATGPGSGMDQDAFGMILIVILIAGPNLVSIMGFQEVRGTEHRPRSPDLDTHDCDENGTREHGLQLFTLGETPQFHCVTA